MKDNIKRFDATVLYYADMLYKSFPKCIDINIYDEMKKEEFKNLYKETEDIQILISETLLWLEENDFLKFETPTKRAYRSEDNVFFGCVRLTAKGLVILKSPPTSIDTKESLGAEVSKALKEKGIIKIAELGTDLAIKLAINLAGW